MSDGKDWKSVILIDYHVDFLGSLLPGLFTFVLGITALGWSAMGLAYACCIRLGSGMANVQAGMQPLALQLSQWKDIGLGATGNIALLLVAAYILGSIFYRQDPKLPDYISARKIYWKTKSSDRARLAVQPSEGRPDITPDDAQFPYLFLYEYLQGRGLSHLAKRIPWQSTNAATLSFRTKMFINILKIRLQYLQPEHCKEVVRNEAHVRMATSVWYATRLLVWLGTFTLLMSIIVAIAGWSSDQSNNQSLLNIAGFNLFVIAFAGMIKYNIEKFIHYLRVREIVNVLETADFAAKNGEETIFRDIFPVDNMLADVSALPEHTPDGAYRAGIEEATEQSALLSGSHH